ncbi:hypothetical protein F5148DRAFT_988974, partial [Russula earlei]
ENMAEVVWETLELYGLKGRIIAITMDNASNNDTMMTTLEACCYAEGIRLSARDSCMRCMPHTIHLAALKLLEAIGAISKRDSEKSAACGGNYQDEVTVRANDDGNACVDDEDCEENVFEAISKVCSICPCPLIPVPDSFLSALQSYMSGSLKSSEVAKLALGSPDVSFRRIVDAGSTAFMLIPDVKTRWSSTYQMLRKWCLVQTYSSDTVLGRALQHREAINTYIYRHED